MKKVEAIIKPLALEAVKAALNARGITGMTISEVSGYGGQQGRTEVYRGAVYLVDFIPQVKIEVVVASEDAEAVAGCICRVINSGQLGEGKICILPVHEVVRIRTGERGKTAI